MRKLILITCSLSILFMSCNKVKGDSCGSNTGAETLMHDNQQREYMLYVPSSYNAAAPTPLVLNFHGFGGQASDYMNDADMRALADAQNFILVYPQGTCLDGSSHWNTSLPGGDNKSEADDFGFIEALISQLSNEYNVDLERIYACGYSNGGMFAYGLANYKSDLIAAVGSVSGTMLDFNGPTSHPMPVIHLHGTADGVIPYEGNNEWNSAQSVINYWINFNNTSTTAIINSDSNDGITIEHYLYEQGDSSVSVEHYKYIGGDHIWYNQTYQGQNAAALIWAFVSKYDINGLL